MANEPSVVNPSAIMEFENSGGAYAAKSIGAELVATREAQEVQVAMAAAKRFPRDPVAAYAKIMQDCTRQSLAAKAMYEFPRGGTRVAGPSIHLARALARGWGNLDAGFKVLDDNGKRSVVLAYCWDLETNYRETKTFDVPHIRHTKKGAVPLEDPRDIYENIANQAARRERSCILSVIPADVVDAALGQCQKTLADGSKKPLADRIRDMVTVFAEIGISAEMLEKFVGYKKEAFSPQTLVRLGGVYTSIKDGVAAPEQYFEMPKIEATQTQENPEPEPPAQDEKPTEVPPPAQSKLADI